MPASFKGHSFAAELCVTAENVGLEGVSMVNDEKAVSWTLIIPK